MTAARWVLRGLWYFRASYAGVLAGCALAAMVLLGALLAGDSVRETLRQTALARLGQIDAVLGGDGRMFRAALAEELQATGVTAAPVLRMSGEITAVEGGRTLGAVQILGVDQRFFALGPEAAETTAPTARGFQINDTLAERLQLAAGASVVLRLTKPSLGPADAPLTGPAPPLAVLRGEVELVRGRDGFGNFSLENSQLPQLTVFVPLARLQQAMECPQQANLLLLRPPAEMTPEALAAALRKRCTLADYGLSVERLAIAPEVEIRTTRVFFERPLAAAIQHALPDARPLLTYLVNAISSHGKSTPYSMVTAATPQSAPFLPADGRGAVVNSWLAEDLGVAPGDELRLDYYAVDANNRLVEREATVAVAAVVPLAGLAADRQWMPEFPGVATAEKTSDWDAGVPIDLKRIRERDEAYWDQYRGAPKLFLPLAVGRELFGNRWGEFTALRVPAASHSREQTAARLLESLTPADAGLRVRPVRAEAMAAAASPVNFAGLLLSMSVFLIVAAVALAALLFRFHLEQRARESGLLAALGVSPARVLRWRLAEGGVLALVGGGVGCLLALAYTRLLLRSLAPVWDRQATSSALSLAANPATLVGGLAVFTALMMLAIWLVTRRQALQSASIRLSAGAEERPPTGATTLPWWAAGWALAAALALTGSRWLGSQGAFFLAGFALLTAGLAGYRWLLQRRWSKVAEGGGELTVRHLARLNCARRPTRSAVVAGTLAAGVFMVVSVAAFRKDGGGDDWRQDRSGSGGFALWVETSQAVQRGSGITPQDPLGLGDARSQFGEILALRQGPGDDASCLNLNQVLRPRLLGVDSAALDRRGAFVIKQTLSGCAQCWQTLREGPVMRAFVDESTLLWVLKRKLGDRVIYQGDDGRDYPVEIAGTLDGSVFQGSFLVDDARLLEHHPQAAGPRLFLLDSALPVAKARAVLAQALADRGPTVETTAERLAAFNSVENTYIGIFQVLGGLGVILGSAGIALLAVRSLIERRGEFAILHTLGIPQSAVRRLALAEAVQLVGWGLGIGFSAALLAILPGLGTAGIAASLPWLLLLAALIAAIALLGSALACRRYFKASFTIAGEQG